MDRDGSSTAALHGDDVCGEGAVAVASCVSDADGATASSPEADGEFSIAYIYESERACLIRYDLFTELRSNLSST